MNNSHIDSIKLDEGSPNKLTNPYIYLHNNQRSSHFELEESQCSLKPRASIPAFQLDLNLDENFDQQLDYHILKNIIMGEAITDYYFKIKFNVSVDKSE